MNKRIAILQSNYIPWKGYFDIIGMVDEFVFYDDVQYTKQDWRNRNLIKTPQGKQWVSIPVIADFGQSIKETRIARKDWASKHWKTISQNYSKTPFFSWCREWLEKLYVQQKDAEFLSATNQRFIATMCGILEIATKLRCSTEFRLGEGKSERLMEICLQANATHYLSGPAAQGYLDVDMFARNGIRVEWMDYTGYPEYPQMYPPFEHGVSIVDLFMNAGPAAREYMKFWKVRG